VAEHRKRPSPQNRSKGEKSRKQGFSRGAAPSQSPWIYGIHAVEAALANKKRRVLRLVATTKTAKGLTILTEIEPEIMDMRGLDSLLPDGSVHQGLALLAEPLSPPTLSDVLAGEEINNAPPLLFLDQVSDPHNVGAILRSAAVFGAKALVVQDRHAPAITGVLAKSASGALELVPIIRVTNLSRALEEVGRAGYFRIGLAGEADDSFSSYQMPGKVALVLGAEGQGLRRLTRENCDVLMKIPTSGTFASLNVSNAAAVALYAISAPLSN